MSVKRYEPEWSISGYEGMEEGEDAEYVLFTDYESLQRERDALREVLVEISGYGTTGEDAREMHEIAENALKEPPNDRR